MKKLLRPHESKELELKFRALQGRQAALAKAKGIAAERGDRSENSAYQYTKQQMSEDGKNIQRYNSEIIASTNYDDKEQKYVNEYLGSQFTLEDLDGEIKSLTLSGQIDFTDSYGKDGNIRGKDVYMNVNSDLGRMFLGSKVGDEILYPIPKEGFGVYTVVKIKKDTDTLQSVLNRTEYNKIKKYRESLLDENKYPKIIADRIEQAIDVVAGEINKRNKKR